MEVSMSDPSTPGEQAEAAKLIAIMNMAFDFTSMSRVFEKGTKDKFIQKVGVLLPKLASVSSANEFNQVHHSFCRWACMEIKRSRKGAGGVSYGQIAKTLNVFLKAAVYYCTLPDRPTAERLIPWLHPAIDNPMMDYLQQKFPRDLPARLDSMVNVDEHIYQVLLDLAGRDINERFGGALTPIQWEDIVWLTINGKM